jgi:thiamine pyrophosphate-dependent acetolactate synthase large subunit-like protein
MVAVSSCNAWPSAGTDPSDGPCRGEWEALHDCELAVFDALARHLPADAMVTVDVGNHAVATTGPALLCVEQDAELL